MGANSKTMLGFPELVAKCNSTGYSETSSFTHDSIIDLIAPITVKECSLVLRSWVVEVGAGNGRLLDLLNQQSYCSVVACNIDSVNVASCRDRGIYVDVCEMHLDRWTKYEADLYIFRHVLEHSPCPMLVLQAAYDTLKVGGFVYVEVPLPDSAFHHEDNPNHYSVLSASMWRSLSRKVGFDIMRDISIDFSVPQEDGRTTADRYLSLILRKG